MGAHVFLAVSAQKGHALLLLTSILPRCKMAKKCIPSLRVCLPLEQGPTFWGLASPLCLLLSGLCFQDSVCALMHITLGPVLSALCLSPASPLRISHHMTNNWPLTAMQPIASQNTRRKSRETIFLSQCQNPRKKLSLPRFLSRIHHLYATACTMNMCLDVNQQ